MMFNKKISAFGLTSAILLSAATAFAADNSEVVTQQKSLLEKLDSLNAAVLGLKINGTAKAGVLSSFSSSDNYAEEGPTQENQAFTDVNLRFTARPSSETMIDVQLRLHKDWQNSYDENNNPIIGHWFSYDGTILDKHVNFNLGYMRVGYTPLTIFTPQTEILQEPEIFSEKRREALEKRNLDTTSRRLLQGLNIEYNSRKLGAVDNVTAQLTGARLRNTAKKVDQVFFDFDFSDRYLLGARAGVEAYGSNLNVNFVNVFDRKQSRRSRAIELGDTVYYEKNTVFSVDANLDSKKLLPTLPVSFGVNGEFAMSKWEADYDFRSSVKKASYNATQGVDKDGNVFVYLKPVMTNNTSFTNEDLANEDGKSFYANLFVKGDISDVDFNVSAGYLKTDSKFWSELASSPVYEGRSVITNSNALYRNPADSALLSVYGASSLENLYFNVYNSTTLQATNLMSTNASNVLSEKNASDVDRTESQYLYSRLNNNYKNGHFYRNGYTGNIDKKLEVNPLALLDPSVSLALPFGLATPNRKGVTAKADVNWADKVFFNARFNMLTESVAVGVDPLTNAVVNEDNKYTEIAAGLGVDIGALVNLDRQILVQGSFSQAKENAYLKRSATRIVGGVTADIWGPISLLAGFQQYEKKFDNGLFLSTESGIDDTKMGIALSVTKASERLVMGGLRVKLAPLSYLSVQYGLLTNDLDYMYSITMGAEDTPVAAGANKLSISKNVIMADVTVNF